MEDEAIREKRRIKILERYKKESPHYEDSNIETDSQPIQKTHESTLSALEKYSLLKKTETKEVFFN